MVDKRVMEGCEFRVSLLDDERSQRESDGNVVRGVVLRQSRVWDADFDRRRHVDQRIYFFPEGDTVSVPGVVSG